MLESLDLRDFQRWTKCNLIYEVAMSLQEPGTQYYGLNTKCPPQAYVLDVWSLDGGAILGESRMGRIRDQARGSRSLGA